MSLVVRSTFLFLLLVIAAECAVRKESCPSENCVSSEKCESPIIGSVCPENSRTCCSILKSEFRTHCRHHGGECMDRCAPSLQRAAVDCTGNKVCCVLV